MRDSVLRVARKNNVKKSVKIIWRLEKDVVYLHSKGRYNDFQ